MTSVSLCSGVPVITAADGKEVGRIKNVYFDKISKSFVYFGVSTGDDMALLPVKSRAVKDAAILASADELLPFDEGAVADCAEGLLGMRVYTLAGVFKGGIADAAFSSDGRLVKLVLPACEVSPSAIATIGDVVLIKTSKPKRTKLPRPKEDYPVTIEETAINAYPNIAPDGVGASSAVDGGRAGSAPAVAVDGADATPAVALGSVGVVSSAVIGEAGAPPAVALGGDGPLFSQGALNRVLGEEATYAPYDPHMPTRVICDYDFLLGRTLGADLYAYSGALLAKKGGLIDVATVEKARAHGKLVDLTLNSVKKSNASVL